MRELDSAQSARCTLTARVANRTRDELALLTMSNVAHPIRSGAASCRRLTRARGWRRPSSIAPDRLSHESLDRPPPNEDDVVIDEGLTKLGTGHDVEIALAPGSIPNRKVHGDGPHLRVVVREMNEELADAGLEMLDDIDVVVLPRSGLHVSERREDGVGKRVARCDVREQVSEHRLVASHADG